MKNKHQGQKQSELDVSTGVPQEDMPELLFKYRFWGDIKEHAHHKRLLTHREFYFSKLSDFNDPFDGQIAPRSGSGDSDSDAQLRDEWSKVKDTYLGVYSLSATPRNLLMWAHYANAHRGMCVGLSTRLICECCSQLSSLANVRSKLRRVDYSQIRTPINPCEPGFNWLDRAKTLIQTKSIHWKDEQEYRMVVVAACEIGRKRVLPEEAFKVVILGCRMPTEKKEEIRATLEEWEAPPRIVEAKVSDSKFELEFGDWIPPGG